MGNKNIYRLEDQVVELQRTIDYFEGYLRLMSGAVDGPPTRQALAALRAQEEGGWNDAFRAGYAKALADAQATPRHKWVMNLDATAAFLATARRQLEGVCRALEDALPAAARP